MSFDRLVSKLQALHAADAKVSAILDVAPAGSARYEAADRRWGCLGDKIISVAEQLSLHTPSGPRQELILILIGLKEVVMGATQDDEAIASLRGVARSLAKKAGLESPAECGVFVGYWEQACKLEQAPATWKKPKTLKARAARASEATSPV